MRQGWRRSLGRIGRRLPDSCRICPRWVTRSHPAISPFRSPRLCCSSAWSTFSTVPPRSRRCVLELEDLHWADPSTRAFLAFLVMSLDDARLLIVGTFRRDDLVRDHPLVATLRQLERRAHVVRLDLPPFDRAEVREQLTAIVGQPPSEASLQAIYARSEGNALFAEELVAMDNSGSDLPATIGEALLAQRSAACRTQPWPSCEWPPSPAVPRPIPWLRGPARSMMTGWRTPSAKPLRPTSSSRTRPASSSGSGMRCSRRRCIATRFQGSGGGSTPQWLKRSRRPRPARSRCRAHLRAGAPLDGCWGRRPRDRGIVGGRRSGSAAISSRRGIPPLPARRRTRGSGVDATEP